MAKNGKKWRKNGSFFGILEGSFDWALTDIFGKKGVRTPIFPKIGHFSSFLGSPDPPFLGFWGVHFGGLGTPKIAKFSPFFVIFGVPPTPLFDENGTPQIEKGDPQNRKRGPPNVRKWGHLKNIGAQLF